MILKKPIFNVRIIFNAKINTFFPDSRYVLLNAERDWNSWELPHDLRSGDQDIFLEIWTVEAENVFLSIVCSTEWTQRA